MLDEIRYITLQLNPRRWAIVGLVLLGAVYLGYHPTLILVLAPLLGLGMLILLFQPLWGLICLVFAALYLPLSFSTGTEVNLNPATLLLPALFVLWLAGARRDRRLHFAPSRTTRPLILFLLSGGLSLLIGNGLWDPAVPRSEHFILVQLAQWSIFVFSALAFWLMANVTSTPAALRRFTWFFLVVAGSGAITYVVLPRPNLFESFLTIAFVRASFWILLAALAGGQLLFNPRLSRRWRLLCLLVLGAVIVYAFSQQVERTSNWVGVVSVASALVWLRLPRLRWLILVVIALLVLGGTFFPALYQFAGGDEKWTESGGSRVVLIQRVLEVSLRNPITGLGPASYRPYANATPLFYNGALWLVPRVSSHNNYVDLFAQTGLLGLGLFLWFMLEVLWLGVRLHRKYREGFLAGYISAMLAVWVGSLAIMMLADWFLPFVYNISFEGFQASILVWLFLGGLVAIERMTPDQLSGEATS